MAEREDEAPLTVKCPRCGGDIEEDDIRSMWGRLTRNLSGRYKDEPLSPGPTPCCDVELALPEVKTLWGTVTSLQRKRYSPGPGRPRSMDRCPCGKMTRKRAEARNHKCKAGPGRPRKRKRG